MLRKLFVAGAAIASASAVAGYVSARTLWRTWGKDAAEAEKALPGDDLVPEAQAVDTRVIEIAAPPEKVWPWLVQLGYGRAGWYSYDRLDMNRPSVETILPEFQSLSVGDIVPTDPRGGLEVKSLDPERALVLYIDRDLATRQWGGPATTPAMDTPVNLRAGGTALDRAMAGDFAASWAVVLEPAPTGTRLVERLRLRIEPTPGRALPPIPRSLVVFGMFVMFRRQMIGIRDRVEGRPIKRRLMFGRLASSATPVPAPA